MTFRVEVSAQAEADAEAILDWLLSEGAGETGIRWFLALRDTISSLAAFPERSALAPEHARFSFEVRQLLYGRKPHVYRILHTIEGETVKVLHIRHARQASSERIRVCNRRESACDENHPSYERNLVDTNPAAQACCQFVTFGCG